MADVSRTHNIYWSKLPRQVAMEKPGTKVMMTLTRDMSRLMGQWATQSSHALVRVAVCLVYRQCHAMRVVKSRAWLRFTLAMH